MFRRNERYQTEFGNEWYGMNITKQSLVTSGME
jgi:hypothetical protein